MHQDALLFFFVGLSGASISLILAFAGGHETLIFSRVLADACHNDSPLREVAGIVSGLTLSFSAIFLYSWISHYHSDDGWRWWRFWRKFTAYNSVVGFVGLAWFSTATNFSGFHNVISGWAVFFISVFVLISWLRYVNLFSMSRHSRPRAELPYWSKLLKIISGILITLDAFAMLIFFFSDNDAAFFVSQAVFWVAVSFGVLALAGENYS